MKNIEQFISRLKHSSELGPSIVYHHRIPEKTAAFARLDPPFKPELISALNNLGISKLYHHQVEAIKWIREKKNVVLATPTASGKTFCYNLPVFETILEDETCRALYLFPIKALEQDQLKSIRQLSRLLNNRIQAAVYDGDTSPYQRKKIRDSVPHIIITNPDMIHMGFLPYHAGWAELFSKLRYIVIDEIHTYRGILGSHLVQVLRRLRRVCQFYGSDPLFIACSATISNPAKLAEALTEKSFHDISQSGAPHPGGHFVFYNPSVSPYSESARLFRQCIHAGLKTIAFTKARKITELLHRWVVRSEPNLSDRISSYRSGFLPEERREIEKKLFSGELQGVISTSALEMGIDVGGLDACLLVGYPGTISATWQRGGRVGRSGAESLIILMAQPNALDQYFMHNPQDLFARPPEEAIVDPENEYVLKEHLLCAAAEIPLRREEQVFPPTKYADLMTELEEQGKILRSASGNEWFSAKMYPQKDVSIRLVGESYTIFEDQDKKVIGQNSGSRVAAECHPGAVYLHRAHQYLVTAWDKDKRNIYVRQMNEDYYTQPRSEKETEILSCDRSRVVGNFVIRQGRLKVTERVVGYEKRRLYGQELLGAYQLDMSPQIFETIGIWIELEDQLKAIIKRHNLDFMGGIHAVEHASLAIFPLFVLCDRNDLGGISYPMHPQVKKGAIFFYDGYPGGVGLCKRGFDLIEDLLKSTSNIIKNCPCLEGCPSCIHSPKCGSGNKPLDKQAAQLTLDILLEEKSLMLDEPNEKTESGGSVIKEHLVNGKPAFMTQGIPASKRLLFFDLETQRSAEEVGGWGNAHLMRLAAGVVFDWKDNKFLVFTEREVEALIEYLQKADLVIGFNIEKFDYGVLRGYSVFDFQKLTTFDILKDIHHRLGFRLSLGHLAKHTLGMEKSADGLQSIQWFREGRLEEVIEYCKKDVQLTREIFEFGLSKGYLLYESKLHGMVRIPVQWKLEEMLGS